MNLVGTAFNADKCFFWDYDTVKKEFIHQLRFDYVSSPELKKPYTYGEETDEWLIETYRQHGYIYVEDFAKQAKEDGPLWNYWQASDRISLYWNKLLLWIV